MRWWGPPKIFISYRRDDSAVHARALYEDLVDTFGERQVFFDVEQIHFGDKFRDILDRRLGASDVIVAVIGPKWLSLTGDDGKPRLCADNDFVRHEIATTLRAGKRLIPVLVGAAEVPAPAALPADIAGLAALNFLRLDDREIGEGNGELVDAIRGARSNRLLSEWQRRRRARTAATGLTLALLFAAWISLFDLLSLDTKSASLTLWLADVVSPEPVAPDLRLVVIGPGTEVALRKAFQANPAARRDHARLIELLAEAGSRTVVFDFFITTPSERDDQVLVQAIRQARASGTSVVFGAREIGRDGLPTMVPALRNAVTNWAMLCIGQRLGYASVVPLLSKRASVTLAAADVAVDATPGATSGATSGAGAAIQPIGMGLSLVAANPGGIRTATIVEDARKVLVFGGSDGAVNEYPYSGIEVADVPQTWCPLVLAGDTVVTALYRMAPLARLQEPGHSLAYESVLALDAGEARQRFGGKTVLVGLQLPDIDVFPVSRGWSTELRHGLELHADATSALMRGAVIQPLGWIGHFGVMLGAMLLGGMVRLWSPNGWSWPRWSLLAAAALAVVGLAVWVCAAYGTLLNLTYVLGALAAGYWCEGRFGLQQRGKGTARPG